MFMVFKKIIQKMPLFFLFLIFAFSVSIARTAGAQQTAGSIDIASGSQQLSSIIISVKTDKAEYIDGEKILIFVTAENQSSQTVILNFNSSYQANYVVDKTYSWSSDKAFTQALTEVVLPSFGTKTWEFIHDTAVNPLSVGTHNIQGEVVGYGNSETTFSVAAPPREYFESFENDFGGWVSDHFIDCEHLPPPVGPCTFTWGIERSTAQAQYGSWALKSFLDGRNDDGTIWVEKSFLAPPNSLVVDVALTFYLWSETVSPVNNWPVHAFIGLFNPETELDLPIIGTTDRTKGWQSYTYKKTILTGADGMFWVAFGFGAVWEVERTYFMDSVSVQIGPVSPAPAPQVTLSFTRNLAGGMSGDDVKELQKILASDPVIYPEGLVSGYFGPLTQKAVIRFQEKYAADILLPIGIAQGTGLVGPMTVKKLNAIRVGVPTTTSLIQSLQLQIQELQKQIEDLQNKIKQLGGESN